MEGRQWVLGKVSWRLGRKELLGRERQTRPAWALGRSLPSPPKCGPNLTPAAHGCACCRTSGMAAAGARFTQKASGAKASSRSMGPHLWQPHSSL